MEIFFQDPSEIPLPPDEIRIKEFSIKEWLDKVRIKIFIKIDKFQQRPNIDVLILSIDGRDEYSVTSIVGLVTQEIELIIHFRGSHEPGEYLLRSILFYTTQSPLINETSFEKPSISNKIIDQKDIIFTST